MIFTVEELRRYIQTAETDEVLAARLSALEMSIRKYTNNNFQNKGYRVTADIRGNVFTSESLIPFKAGDTVVISNSDLQEACLCTVKEVTDTTFTVNEDVAEENNILVTKVGYPIDIKMGAINILKWQLKNEAANSGDKAAMAIQEESLSRYSVTYAQDASEADIDAGFGVPKKYLAFLKMHRKARF